MQHEQESLLKNKGHRSKTVTICDLMLYTENRTRLEVGIVQKIFSRLLVGQNFFSRLISRLF